MTRGLGGPDIGFETLRGDELADPEGLEFCIARRAALPTETVRPCRSAVGLRACGPEILIAGSRRAGTDGGLLAELVDAELDRRRVRKPDLSGVIADCRSPEGLGMVDAWDRALMLRVDLASLGEGTEGVARGNEALGMGSRPPVVGMTRGIFGGV